ncbi:MAG: tetratricopeptide repeat protein [Flavobacteriales bacterium]|nr:tetratricopeptide repeat protein [Flavobacteriales bacterium]
MQQRKFECAKSDFTKAANADARFVEPRIMLAEIAEMEGKDAEAITRYREAMTIAPRFFPTAQLHLADLEFRSGQYAEAEKNYKGYLDKEQEPQRKARARLGIANCQFAADAIATGSLRAKELGPGVNSADPEYYPCITADDATLIFTRRVKAPEIAIYGMQEDFYVSRRGADGAWQPSKPIPTVSTAEYNEGAGTLTAWAMMAPGANPRSSGRT